MTAQGVKSFLWPLLTGAIILLGAPGWAMAEDTSEGWAVTSDIQDEINTFAKSSPIVEGMRRFNEPDTMVYTLEYSQSPLLPVYDLLACMHLTNPDSKMEVDSGGGFDVTIEDVTFPGGVWPVHVRIREVDRIELLEKYQDFILDKIVIDNLIFRDVDRLVRAIRLLSSVCLEGPAEN